MMSIGTMIWFLALCWFIFYWIIGGALFAALSYIRTRKIRTARFSTLFTLAAFGSAYAAARAGYVIGKGNIDHCLEQAEGFSDRLAAVFGCGILEFSLAGMVGFAGLMVLGLFLLFLSRAENQSWIDSDMALEEKEELSFDNG